MPLGCATLHRQHPIRQVLLSSGTAAGGGTVGTAVSLQLPLSCEHGGSRRRGSAGAQRPTPRPRDRTTERPPVGARHVRACHSTRQAGPNCRSGGGRIRPRSVVSQQERKKALRADRGATGPATRPLPRPRRACGCHWWSGTCVSLAGGSAAGHRRVATHPVASVESERRRRCSESTRGQGHTRRGRSSTPVKDGPRQGTGSGSCLPEPIETQGG